MSKAILIDATNKCVREYEYNGLDSAQSAVGGMISGAVRFDNDDYLFVNDEGLLIGFEDFFRIEGGCQPYAGNGLIVGREDDDGKTQDVSFTVDEVRERVSFCHASEIDVERLCRVEVVTFDDLADYLQSRK